MFLFVCTQNYSKYTLGVNNFFNWVSKRKDVAACVGLEIEPHYLTCTVDRSASVSSKRWQCDGPEFRSRLDQKFVQQFEVQNSAVITPPCCNKYVGPGPEGLVQVSLANKHSRANAYLRQPITYEHSRKQMRTYKKLVLYSFTDSVRLPSHQITRVRSQRVRLCALFSHTLVHYTMLTTHRNISICIKAD